MDVSCQQVDWFGGSETMEEILQRIAAVKKGTSHGFAFSHQAGY